VSLSLLLFCCFQTYWCCCISRKILVQKKQKYLFTAALANITEKQDGKVLFAALLMAVVSIYGITKLKVKNSFVNYFSNSTNIYRGLKLIDDKLGEPPVSILS